MCDVKLLLIMVLTLVVLKGVRAGLGWLYPRTKTTIDDKLFLWVTALILLIEWVIARARGKK